MNHTLKTFKILPGLIKNLEFKLDNMKSAIGPDMHMTDKALDLVAKEGMPFRDAYKKVAVPK